MCLARLAAQVQTRPDFGSHRVVYSKIQLVCVCVVGEGGTGGFDDGVVTLFFFGLRSRQMFPL